MYEQRAKLLYEIDRAANKERQHGAVIEQLERMRQLTGEEVSRLRGQLKAVEHDHKLLVQVTCGSRVSDLGYRSVPPELNESSHRPVLRCCRVRRPRHWIRVTRRRGGPTTGWWRRATPSASLSLATTPASTLPSSPGSPSSGPTLD